MEDARKTLILNIKKGFSVGLKKPYFYISPDKVHYHQWFWDSSFHIIVSSILNPEWAKLELKTLLSVQEENGFIPHVIFWKLRSYDFYHLWWIRETNLFPYYTAEIQPPVIGISLKRIFDATQDIDFIKENISKVEKFYLFLEKERDPDKDGLISIITPMESGMDLSPQYDIALGNKKHDPLLTKKKIKNLLKIYRKMNWNYKKILENNFFDVEDVAFNVIYCLGLEAISEIYKKLGDKNKGNFYEKKAASLTEKIISKFWDDKEKIFFSLWRVKNKEKFLKVKTISSLFPIALNIPSKYINYLLQHITNRKEFWAFYPLPTVSMDEPSFGPLTDTRYIWRGTTWINTNWFIATGLKRHKEFKIFKRLKEKTIELIKRAGFCEFYDPFTAEPGKAMKGFGWSTLVVDFLT